MGLRVQVCDDGGAVEGTSYYLELEGDADEARHGVI